MKDNKMTLSKVLVVIAILAISVFSVAATSEYTQTVIHFNVASVVAFTVTVLGESATTSDPTAASAATNDIEFNSSDGSDDVIEPHVVGGSSNTQSSGNPIFTVDNTGTTNLNMTMYTNATLADACMNLTWGATWATRNLTIVSSSTVANSVAIDTSFAPDETAKTVYLVAGMMSCNTNASSRKLLKIEGNTVGA